MRLTYDQISNTAYLYIADEGTRVAETLTFADDDDRLAWGINLDFDEAGRLVGVEFEDATGQIPSRVLQNLADQ